MQNMTHVHLRSYLNLHKGRHQALLEVAFIQFFSIRDIHWPQLRYLSLNGGCYINPTSFLAFLQRHGTTLCYLDLHDIVLNPKDECSWVDLAVETHECLPLLSGCKFSHLTDVSEPLFHSDYRTYSVREVMGRRNCNYRQRHIDILQECVLGHLGLESDSPIPGLYQLREVRSNWRNYEAMDRGLRAS